jgi:hypothetical protein
MVITSSSLNHDPSVGKHATRCSCSINCGWRHDLREVGVQQPTVASPRGPRHRCRVCRQQHHHQPTAHTSTSRPQQVDFPFGLDPSRLRNAESNSSIHQKGPLSMALRFYRTMVLMMCQVRQFRVAALRGPVGQLAATFPVAGPP